MSEDRQSTLLCPYCGEPTVMTPSSSVPYCTHCQRYIYAAAGDGPLSPYAQQRSRLRSGIGGWLLFPAVGALVLPVAFLAVITTSISARTDHAWLFAEHPDLVTLTTVETVGSVLLLVLSLAVLFLFFARHRMAPKLYIVLLASLTMLRFLLLLMSIPLWAQLEGLAHDLITNVMLACAAAGASAAYFVRSDRVRATFVR